jgi:hypothetical protein
MSITKLDLAKKIVSLVLDEAQLCIEVQEAQGMIIVFIWAQSYNWAEPCEMHYIVQ